MIRNIRVRNRFTAAALVLTLGLLPLAVIGQTRISMPKNKYKVEDDVKIGNDAARQVEKQYPLIDDAAARRYVESVGQKLVAAIPVEFQQPAFHYRFEIVNASDINAFALPGGPMFVNRGMIEAAKNEGEMAGVMAHEMSHVALRHATAQQTKASSPWNQILGIGAIVGGGVFGGETGAQAGQVLAAGYFLHFSREYEKQADILGARIMANAGYDPRDLANMFQTIERQGGGGRAPQWLSDHPNPGNRFQYINAEAAKLPVSPNPIKVTPGFSRTQEKFRSMAAAPTMTQIQQGIQRGQVYGNGRGTSTRTGNGRGNGSSSSETYSNTISVPSTRVRVYSNDLIQMSIPSNWQDTDLGSSVQFAPEGASGNDGITHGALVGVDSAGSGGARQASQNYVDSLLQGNSYLRQQGSLADINFNGRQGFTATLSGISPITQRSEIVTVYATLLRNGQLLYIATVTPKDESYRYSTAFRNMLASIKVND